jgi:hypothetical protein
MRIYNSTIAKNKLWGLDSIVFTSPPAQGSLRIESSILADNESGDLGANLITSMNSSLVESLFGTPASGSGNVVGLDAALGSLAMNGGPTPTILPLPGSLAIDAGSNPRGLTVDQRGNAREQGARIDMGAVETVPEPGAALLATIAVVCIGRVGRARRRR